MSEFLRKISGVDNPIGTFVIRLIIGLVFIIYGIFVLYFSQIVDTWTKLSIALAFFGLGLMFILDGQAILRQYFQGVPSREICLRRKNILSTLTALFFVIGSIIFFVEFSASTAPPLYLPAVYSILLIIILFFHERIAHIELSKGGIIVKMKEGEEKAHEKIEYLKNEWGYFEKGGKIK